MSRRTKYTAKIAGDICERLSEGESLRKICADARMPSKRTVMTWLSEKDDFRKAYLQARELMLEELIDLADTPVLGTKTTTKDGKVETVTGDMVDRSKLQVHARMWALSRLLPKKYGERQQLEHSGQVGLAALVMTSFHQTNKQQGEDGDGAPS